MKQQKIVIDLNQTEPRAAGSKAGSDFVFLLKGQGCYKTQRKC